MDDPRAERILLNEQRVREVNQRLKGDLERLPDDGRPVRFVCECGYLECSEAVLLSVSEWAAVHADPWRFAVLAGHELPDVEEVVERGPRYLVVRKLAR